MRNSNIGRVLLSASILAVTMVSLAFAQGICEKHSAKITYFKPSLATPDKMRLVVTIDGKPEENCKPNNCLACTITYAWYEGDDWHYLPFPWDAGSPSVGTGWIAPDNYREWHTYLHSAAGGGPCHPGLGLPEKWIAVTSYNGDEVGDIHDDNKEYACP